MAEARGGKYLEDLVGGTVETRWGTRLGGWWSKGPGARGAVEHGAADGEGGDAKGIGSLKRKAKGIGWGRVNRGMESLGRKAKGHAGDWALVGLTSQRAAQARLVFSTS